MKGGLCSDRAGIHSCAGPAMPSARIEPLPALAFPVLLFRPHRAGRCPSPDRSLAYLITLPFARRRIGRKPGIARKLVLQICLLRKKDYGYRQDNGDKWRRLNDLETRISDLN